MTRSLLLFPLLTFVPLALVACSKSNRSSDSAPQPDLRTGIEYVGNALLAAGFPMCYADNLNEIFGPTGLVRSDTSASKKPAFDEFVMAVRELSQQQ